MPGPDRLPHLSEAWLTAVDEAVVAHEGLRRVSADLELVIEYRVAGVPEDTIRKILVDNPRRFLAFVPKA